MHQGLGASRLAQAASGGEGYQELEVAFESLYLDDEQETIHGIKRKEQERVEVTRNMRIKT
jgi:hypothetical protein